MKAAVEALEKQNQTLTENLAEVTEAYKQLEGKSTGAAKELSQ